GGAGGPGHRSSARDRSRDGGPSGPHRSRARHSGHRRSPAALQRARSGDPDPPVDPRARRRSAGGDRRRSSRRAHQPRRRGARATRDRDHRADRRPAARVRGARADPAGQHHAGQSSLRRHRPARRPRGRGLPVVRRAQRGRARSTGRRRASATSGRRFGYGWTVAWATPQPRPPMIVSATFALLMLGPAEPAPSVEPAPPTASPEPSPEPIVVPAPEQVQDAAESGAGPVPPPEQVRDQSQLQPGQQPPAPPNPRARPSEGVYAVGSSGVAPLPAPPPPVSPEAITRGRWSGFGWLSVRLLVSGPIAGHPPARPTVISLGGGAEGGWRIRQWIG